MGILGGAATLAISLSFLFMKLKFSFLTLRAQRRSQKNRVLEALLDANYHLHPYVPAATRISSHCYHLARFPRCHPLCRLDLRRPRLRRCSSHPLYYYQEHCGRLVTSRSVHDRYVFVLQQCSDLLLSVHCHALLVAHSRLHPARVATGQCRVTGMMWPIARFRRSLPAHSRFSLSRAAAE